MQNTAKRCIVFFGSALWVTFAVLGIVTLTSITHCNLQTADLVAISEYQYNNCTARYITRDCILTTIYQCNTIAQNDAFFVDGNCNLCETDGREDDNHKAMIYLGLAILFFLMLVSLHGVTNRHYRENDSNNDSTQSPLVNIELGTSIEDISIREKMGAICDTACEIVTDVDDLTICPICIENKTIPSITWVQIRVCKHIMHKACLLDWMMRVPSAPPCPMCRTIVEI